MQNSTSGKWYDSLEAAVAEAGSGDVLTLSDSVALASTVVIDKDLMIDLNVKALDSETVSIVVPVAADEPGQFFSLGVRE